MALMAKDKIYIAQQPNFGYNRKGATTRPWTTGA